MRVSIKEKIIQGLIEDIAIDEARIAVEINENEIEVLTQVVRTFEEHLKHNGSLPDTEQKDEPTK